MTTEDWHKDDRRLADVTWKDYVDIRLAENQKAIEVARDGMEYRLEQMNEFRKQIASERDDYLRKDVYLRGHEDLERRLMSLEAYRSKALGVMAAVAFIITLALGFIDYIIK